MSCSIRKGLNLSATVAVLATGALIAPAAAQATVQPEDPPVTAADASAISHLVLHPGSDETALNFNWFTSSESTEQVQIAPASAQTGTEFPVDEAATFEATMSPENDRNLTTAKATATNLEADTEYLYRVGSEAGGWSSTYEYSSPSIAEGFNFNFYGDAQLGSGDSTQLGGGGGLEQDAQGWYNTLETSTEMYPDASFLFHAGDQIDGYHDEGPLEEWLGDRDPQYDAFLAEEADVLREIPLAVLSGNHDDPGWTYDEYWNMPNAQERNYWYTHDNALVIGLDTNTTSIEDLLPLMSLPEDEIAEAYAQAMDEQRPEIISAHQELINYVNTVIGQHGADAEWIIVGFHQSPFSQAYHGQDDFDIQLMREEGFTQALSDAGVDLVLGGHDHIYTRTHLLEGNDPVVPDGDTDGPLPKQDGQTMYLTGTSSSGSKYYDFMDSSGEDDEQLVNYDDPLATTAAWNQDYQPGFSNIAIDGSELTVRTHHSDDGALIDEVTLAKGLPEEDDDTGEEETPGGTDDDTTGSDDTGDREEVETPGDNSNGDSNEDGITTVGDGDVVGEENTDANADETAASKDDLAITGSTMMPVMIAGGVLLATGGAILLWARRRKA